MKICSQGVIMESIYVVAHIVGKLFVVAKLCRWLFEIGYFRYSPETI